MVFWCLSHMHKCIQYTSILRYLAGIEVYALVWIFIYFHTLCKREAKAIQSLRCSMLWQVYQNLICTHYYTKLFKKLFDRIYTEFSLNISWQLIYRILSQILSWQLIYRVYAKYFLKAHIQNLSQIFIDSSYTDLTQYSFWNLIHIFPKNFFNAKIQDLPQILLDNSHIEYAPNTSWQLIYRICPI